MKEHLQYQGCAAKVPPAVHAKNLGNQRRRGTKGAGQCSGSFWMELIGAKPLRSPGKKITIKSLPWYIIWVEMYRWSMMVSISQNFCAVLSLEPSLPRCPRPYRYRRAGSCWESAMHDVHVTRLPSKWCCPIKIIKVHGAYGAKGSSETSQKHPSWWASNNFRHRWEGAPYEFITITIHDHPLHYPLHYPYIQQMELKMELKILSMQDDSAASGEFFLKLLAKSASALSPTATPRQPTLCWEIFGSLYALHILGYSWLIRLVFILEPIYWVLMGITLLLANTTSQSTIYIYILYIYIGIIIANILGYIINNLFGLYYCGKTLRFARTRNERLGMTMMMMMMITSMLHINNMY